MSDMRLIVAGAGGRMGRALMRTISETSGAVAVRRAGGAGLARCWGKDAGVLAGLAGRTASNSPPISGRCRKTPTASWISPCRRATIANVAIAAQRGLVHVIGTTGLSASDNAVIKSVTAARHRREVRQYEPRRQSAGRRWSSASRKSLDEGFDIEIAGDASQGQDRRALRHRADAGRGGGRAAAGIKLEPAFGARPRRPYRRAQARRYRLCLACAAALSSGDHRVIFAGPAERIELSHQGRGSHDLRPWRAEGGVVGARQEAGLLLAWPTCSALVRFLRSSKRNCQE